MNPNTRALHALGQSLWLDNISRRLLHSGALGRYIAELSVSGLSLHPTIFTQAIENDDSYDADIQELAAEGLSGEDIFFRLALDDLTEAADLFHPIHQASQGLDGWVCLAVFTLARQRHRQQHQDSPATARTGSTPEPDDSASGNSVRPAGH